MMNDRPKPLYYPGPCVTCGNGFYLPSGRCDHCDSLQPTKKFYAGPELNSLPSGPRPPGFHHFKAGVKCGHRMGMLEGRWNGMWTGIGIGLLFGAGITAWILL